MRLAMLAILPLLGLGFFSVLAAVKKENRDVAPDSASVVKPETSSRSSEEQLYAYINNKYQSVRPILQKHCYNCHSDKTRYPWYYKFPLVRSIIDDDIKEAREQMDLSADFPFSGKHSQLEFLVKIQEEILEGDMPPWNYRLMHISSSIDGDERDSLFVWLDSSRRLLIKFQQSGGTITGP